LNRPKHIHHKGKKPKQLGKKKDGTIRNDNFNVETEFHIGQDTLAIREGELKKDNRLYVTEHITNFNEWYSREDINIPLFKFMMLDARSI